MAETKLLGKSDEEEIWLTIRSVLTFARVVVLFGTIVVSELFEEYYFLDLTIAIWSLIIGIPLFFVISVLILWGNKSFIPVDPKEQMTTILRPILERT
ncbi:MAG TPA: hypothetical protein D7H87_04345 [Candidatus Poseidoniales archaeon]|nr:hypothetical protein [Euryarchaeota archaeon]DAC50217.1 MAG TPA: hypothetical protein D7H87_04345 [Candidatus Poseidoniales archaeon]HII32515.1 hypothetical protein [Candidatus Poseidoniaceae archaeon]|tara:strand:- start:2622 stop:2915 length:294 start_codon:yes stop_codon:yes gene_type:complete